MVGVVSAGIGFPEVMEVYPGETMDKELRILNLNPDDPDMIYRGTILGGGDIVSFKGDGEFNAPSGQVTKVPLRVRVPSDAVIGQTYEIRMFFRSEAVGETGGAASGGGSVQFNKGYGFSFDVKVIPKPVTPETETPAGTNYTWLWILAIAVIIVIVWIILSRKKKK